MRTVGKTNLWSVEKVTPDILIKMIIKWPKSTDVHLAIKNKVYMRKKEMIPYLKPVSYTHLDNGQGFSIVFNPGNSCEKENDGLINNPTNNKTE